MKNEMFELLKKSGRPYQATIVILNDEIVVLNTTMISKEQYAEIRGEDVQPNRMVNVSD